MPDLCYDGYMKTPRIILTLSAVLVALVTAAGVAVAAGAVSLGDPTTWATATTWHLAPAPGADVVLKRQLGTGYGDTPDDTIPVTLTASGGSKITTHSSAWESIDLTALGVPATATAATLQVKAVETVRPSDEATVYAFVKESGVNICPGPPGFESYPVDFTWDGEPGAGGEKCWAVHASIDGGPKGATGNGVREFDTVTVPLVDGHFDFAWGYRRGLTGVYPAGSALAVGVWLDGWAS